MADKLGRSSVLYAERKKDWRALGLLWMEKIVPATLLCFLGSTDLRKTGQTEEIGVWGSYRKSWVSAVTVSYWSRSGLTSGITK